MAELSFLRRNIEAIMTGLVTTAITGGAVALYGEYPTLLAPFAYCVACGAATLIGCIAVMILRRIPNPLPCPDQKNIEGYVRKWLDSYGLTVTRDPSEATCFRFRVQLPPPDKENLTVFQMRNETPEYVLIYADMGLKGEVGEQILNTFTQREINQIIYDIKLELARAKVGYSGLCVPPTDFQIFRRLLIHPGLKESDFFSAIGEVEAAMHIVVLIYQRAVEQTRQPAQTTKQPPVLVSDTPIRELPLASS